MMMKRKIKPLALLCGGAVVAAFVVQLATVLNRFPGGAKVLEPLAAPLDDTRNIGFTLFSNYNLPFQAVGALVLVATIGVVVLSKRELK